MRHNLLMHMLHQPGQIEELALHIHRNACLHTRFHGKTISRTALYMHRSIYIEANCWWHGVRMMPRWIRALRFP